METARLPSMLLAIEKRELVTIPAASTIADGIAVRRAGEVTFPLVAKYVDEIVTVEEEEIASAILTLLEREKTLAEGAGAAGIAALLQHKTSLNGQHTAVIIGGGNIDVSLLSRIIERGLVKDGRLVRIRIYLPDRPGALAELSSVIAAQRANIVELLFNRAYYGVSLGDTAIDDDARVQDLVPTLRAGGPEQADEAPRLEPFPVFRPDHETERCRRRADKRQCVSQNHVVNVEIREPE